MPFHFPTSPPAGILQGHRLLKDLTGKSFDWLTVTAHIGHKVETRFGTTRAFWWCRCRCGTACVVTSYALRGKRKLPLSCGCFWKTPAGLRTVKLPPAGVVGADNSKWRGFGEISGKYWSGIRNRARKNGTAFTVTIQQAWRLFLQQNRRCALTGALLCFPVKSGSKFTASLDRIDSSKGYTIKNVQWLHRDINLMKLDHSTEEFIRLCSLVVEYRKGGFHHASSCGLCSDST